MMAPCEYCGKWCDADPFMKWGVPPCCEWCGRHVLQPIVIGIALIAVALIAVALIAWVVS